MAKQHTGCGTIAAAIGICLLIFYFGSMWDGRRFTPVTATPNPTPAVDCGAETQAKRVQLIKRLQAEEIISKCDYANNVCHLWVRPAFYGLDFDTKQKFVSVAAAWALCENSQADLVVLYDNQSGKPVGRYAAAYGGLEMD